MAGDVRIAGVLAFGTVLDRGTNLFAVHARDGRFGPNGAGYGFDNQNPRFSAAALATGLGTYGVSQVVPESMSDVVGDVAYYAMLASLLVSYPGRLVHKGAARGMMRACGKLAVVPLSEERLERMSAFVMPHIQGKDLPRYSVTGVTGDNCATYTCWLASRTGLSVPHVNTPLGVGWIIKGIHKRWAAHADRVPEVGVPVASLKPNQERPLLERYFEM